jgi:hypothetical protein
MRLHVARRAQGSEIPWVVVQLVAVNVMDVQRMTPMLPLFAASLASPLIPVPNLPSDHLPPGSVIPIRHSTLPSGILRTNLSSDSRLAPIPRLNSHPQGCSANRAPIDTAFLRDVLKGSSFDYVLLTQPILVQIWRVPAMTLCINSPASLRREPSRQSAAATLASWTRDIPHRQPLLVGELCVPTRVRTAALRSRFGLHDGWVNLPPHSAGNRSAGQPPSKLTDATSSP